MKLVDNIPVVDYLHQSVQIINKVLDLSALKLRFNPAVDLSIDEKFVGVNLIKVLNQRRNLFDEVGAYCA